MLFLPERAKFVATGSRYPGRINEVEETAHCATCSEIKAPIALGIVNVDTRPSLERERGAGVDRHKHRSSGAITAAAAP